MQPDTIISTILKHDKKDTSYKFALLRAINDVALNFPDLGNFGQDVAVPLKVLAQFWVAYYWPFLELAYRHYSTSNLLLVALQEDVEVRFSDHLSSYCFFSS